ncbi:uncharacterized protein LOC116843073 isoform X2 [Odontomachus brunneus]|uniref:uncharacterized protein LOC116843073 isoform X2 n=1 Tax=Odontomachus brunneus TaxID=486640 RepID=UPI0013F23D60|nr:uncharacterized protein LOC116843073 isoform X2 [Odontomachus brunneus]
MQGLIPYEDSETSHNSYDQFFHPNVCHICKSKDQDQLILCQCGMISYCTEEHKMQHRPQHKEICGLIKLLKTCLPDTPSLFFDEWIETQQNFIEKLQIILTHKIKQYEVQMLMFEKICFICQKQYIFYTCEACLSISYCVDHVDQIYLHYGATCTQLAISLDIDIILSKLKISEILSIQFPIFSDKEMFFTDMDSFCSQYYHKTRIHDYYCLDDYVFTDYISSPLTLYSVLQTVKLFRLIKLMDTFVIHIIATDYVEKYNFPVWELFLHLLNKKVKLVVVIIGPELQYEINEYQVCSHCKTANKKLIIQFFPLLYHNYVHSINYRRPNIIIGFQAEFNHGTSIKPAFQARNKFASSRPYRDFDTGHVFYRNIYLIFYRNLKDSSNSTHFNSKCRV